MKIEVQEVSTLGANEAVVAYVVILLDGWLAVRDIKVVRARTGAFVSMPNRLAKDGEWHDVVHPINREGRAELEATIMRAVAHLL